MKKIIEDMIESAEKHHNYEMADFAYRLMAEMASTYNCPSNWSDIGEEMRQEHAGNDWVEENCRLWDF